MKIKITNLKNRLTVLRYAGNDGYKVIFLCVISMIVSVASVLQALTTKYFIDYAVAKNQSQFFLWIGLFFGLILLRIFLKLI